MSDRARNGLSWSKFTNSPPSPDHISLSAVYLASQINPWGVGLFKKLSCVLGGLGAIGSISGEWVSAKNAG